MQEGRRAWCYGMIVFDVVFVCVCYEAGVSEGCGFALCPKDKCVWL
jgi:hypothetical protein